MKLTTIAERKSREAERRALAAAEIAEELRCFARDRRGRFVLFGSFVTGRMRHNSDLDVLIDFAEPERAEAWSAVEDACRRAGLEADIHEAAASKPAFLKRVLATGLVLR